MAHGTSFHDTYVSPLTQRNASREMQGIWSPRHRFSTWRRIWLAVAEAQHELGLPVSREQVEAIRARLTITDEEIKRAIEHERKLKHDVMSHVHALGDSAPAARGIIHLGMTSQDVVCNADLILLREALELVAVKIARAIDALGTFAEKWKDTPTLGYTHYQPAQPTTVGRRAAGWGYDLSLCLTRIESTLHQLKLRGLKGAVGTQASFLNLLDHHPGKVDQLEAAFVRKLGWPANMVHDLTWQTYPRVVDAMVLGDLSCTASVCHKICTDIRLACGRKELDEPFGESQVGSSAMPYKQNPMRCERACGLARLVVSLASNAYETAGVQWFERTLDDSSNRRVVLPEAFLSLDGVLDLVHSVVAGLVVHVSPNRQHLMAELPFLVIENVLVAAVKAGKDRQEVHEALRRHAIAAGKRVKEQGLPNDLAERLESEPVLHGVRIEQLMDPMGYVGRAREQVDKFLADVVSSVRRGYSTKFQALSSSEPKV
ncbi:adenylosuccinate lyase [Leptolyngbya sp. 15MV]|nr:adenylosuccinate lyase [Leptolyngbya sp. 15MV]